MDAKFSTKSTKWCAVLLLAVLDVGAAAEAQAHPSRVPSCERVVDASIPRGTRFPYAVKYQIGASNREPGDRILIREVRGTRRKLEIGGIYRVIGEY